MLLPVEVVQRSGQELWPVVAVVHTLAVPVALELARVRVQPVALELARVRVQPVALELARVRVQDLEQ